jgi:hypothetical protein
MKNYISTNYEIPRLLSEFGNRLSMWSQTGYSLNVTQSDQNINTMSKRKLHLNVKTRTDWFAGVAANNMKPSTTFEEVRISLICLELRNWIFQKFQNYVSLNS